MDDRDRRRFLQLLGRTARQRRWKLLAFVLMSNHYHLLFETPETNLSRGMKDLDGDYASWFNVRHERVGHLFQGRFKSHLVDSDTYLLEVARYIVLNPVRAGMVQSPGAWRWSSYGATAGLMTPPPWLDPKPILMRLDTTSPSQAAEEYRRFVAAGTGETASPWENLVAQTFLGGEEFLRAIEERIHERQRSREHPSPQRNMRTLSLNALRDAIERHSSDGWLPRERSTGRLAFALLAARWTTANRAAIGDSLGITGQAAGRLITRAEKRSLVDDYLMRLLTAVENEVR